MSARARCDWDLGGVSPVRNQCDVHKISSCVSSHLPPQYKRCDDVTTYV